ncbi:MAG: AIM24 family protein, partial [bacterium]
MSPSGWEELPGVRDMARLQIGRSYCQVEGTYVPMAEFALAEGDGVYFGHHVLLWMEPNINVSTMSLAGGWRRMLGGMPIVMAQAWGPGRIAFSHDEPGEMLAVPLQHGQSIDVREHAFVVATANVGYDFFDPRVYMSAGSGNERTTSYPVGLYMDRFTAAEQPGLVILHAHGNVFLRHLGADETILVHPSSLLFKDPTVQMHLHAEHPAAPASGAYGWTGSIVWLRLYGPGRVAIRSAFENFEAFGSTANVNHSPWTERRVVPPNADGSLVPEIGWYYVEEGRTVGPTSLAHPQGLALVGRLPKDAPLWREGMGDWSTIGRVSYCAKCQYEG